MPFEGAKSRPSPNIGLSSSTAFLFLPGVRELEPGIEGRKERKRREGGVSAAETAFGQGMEWLPLTLQAVMVLTVLITGVLFYVSWLTWLSFVWLQKGDIWSQDLSKMWCRALSLFCKDWLTFPLALCVWLSFLCAVMSNLFPVKSSFPRTITRTNWKGKDDDMEVSPR